MQKQRMSRSFPLGKWRKRPAAQSARKPEVRTIPSAGPKESWLICGSGARHSSRIRRGRRFSGRSGI
nr:MAG TPA: hypothetical protein [Caudoviricetes sp.]